MAFEPPSDYVPAGGSSNAKKVWMVLGGGCLLVLIVIGIAFAAGAFKAISCCSDFQDVAVRSIEAQKFGAEFANHVHLGDTEAAYNMGNEAMKSSGSLEEFQKACRVHDKTLRSGLPKLMMINVDQKPGQGLSAESWKATYQFAKSTDEEMVVLSILITMDQTDPPTYAIGSHDFDLRTRDLGSEAPAVEVLEFHSELQRGNHEMAFGRLGEGFKAETDMAAFKAFLDDQGPIMTDSTLLIQEVAYPDAQRATVIAVAKTDDGKRALVQYELLSPFPNLPAWQIMAISPMIEAVDPVVEPDGADAGTSDAAATD